MLNKALDLHPNDQEVIAYIGVVDYHRNEHAKSLGHLKELKNPYTNPNNEMILNPRKANLLLQAFSIKAKGLEKASQPEEAIIAYQTLIDISSRFSKSNRIIEAQARPLIIDAFMRMVEIQKYFGSLVDPADTKPSQALYIPTSQDEEALLALHHAEQIMALSNPHDNVMLSKAYLLIGVAHEKKALECKSYNEKQKNQKESLSNLQMAYRYDPSDHQVPYHLALIYADIRETRLGLKYIQESLAINPDEPAAWNLLSLLLSSNKAYELAYRSVKHALNQSPSNLELLLAKAKLEIALDDGSQALLTYRSAMTHLANQTLTSTLDICDDLESMPRNRNQSGAPSSLVSFDIRSGGTTESRSTHRAPASDVMSGDAEDSPRDHLGVKISEGHALINSRDNQRRVTLWLSIAEAFTRQHMFEDAAACLSQAGVLAPHNPDVFYQQGFLLDIQELRADALIHYHKALAIEPGHTNSAIRVAVNHFNSGDLLLAENNLTTILRSSDPTSHYAWFQLGLVLKAKGEIDPAAGCFQRAIELDKTSPLIPYETISRHIV
eukprot:gene7518-8797_t